MLSKAKQSKAKHNFKLFQKLCLYNLLFCKKILFFFVIKKEPRQRRADAKNYFFFCQKKKQKNNRKRNSKSNSKKLFSVFGKSFNRLYNEFLRQKIIYLFKYSYQYLSIENKGYNGLLSKIYSNLKSRRYYYAKFLL